MDRCQHKYSICFWTVSEGYKGVNVSQNVFQLLWSEANPFTSITRSAIKTTWAISCGEKRTLSNILHAQRRKTRRSAGSEPETGHPSAGSRWRSEVLCLGSSTAAQRGWPPWPRRCCCPPPAPWGCPPPAAGWCSWWSPGSRWAPPQRWTGWSPAGWRTEGSPVWVTEKLWLRFTVKSLKTLKFNSLQGYVLHPEVSNHKRKSHQVGNTVCNPPLLLIVPDKQSYNKPIDINFMVWLTQAQEAQSINRNYFQGSFTPGTSFFSKKICILTIVLQPVDG